MELYHKTWEIAAGRVRKGPEGLPGSPYMDENCYEDQIWIWDTCFMVLFAKYAPNSFPGEGSMDNLYKPIWDKEKLLSAFTLLTTLRYSHGLKRNITTLPETKTAFMKS